MPLALNVATGGVLFVYAVAPLAYFRQRYSAEALNLTSTDRRVDALVIAVGEQS